MEKPIEYEQYDRRWAGIVYSNHGDAGQTIKTSGCGPTCAAMVIATLRDESVTPDKTCSWANSHGYRSWNSGTKWAYFAEQMAEYGIEIKQTDDTEAALSALADNHMVIVVAAKGIWTSSGHFILAYYFDRAKGIVHINDPNSEAKYRELADVSYFRRQTTQYFIIKEEIMGKMTGEEIYVALMEHLKTLPTSEYAKEASRKGVEKGVFSDGDKDGMVDNPQGIMRRQELAVVLDRLGLLD